MRGGLPQEDPRLLHRAAEPRILEGPGLSRHSLRGREKTSLNVSQDFGVSPEKTAALRERIKRLGIDPARIEESVARGSGKGGQKINKSSNCVRLRYPPLGLDVRVQRERKLSLNRFLALRGLVDQIELRLDPGSSKRLIEAARARKRKARRAARSRAKYGRGTPSASAPEGPIKI